MDYRHQVAEDVRKCLSDGMTYLRDIQSATGHNRAALQRAMRDIGASRDDSTYPYRFTL